MKPKLELFDTGDAGGKVLRVTPFADTSAKGRLTPKSPLEYTFSNDADATILSALLNSTNRSVFSMLLARTGLTTEQMAMAVTRINDKLSDAGMGIVDDEVGNNIYNYSLRFEPKIWGELEESSILRAGRRLKVQAPRPQKTVSTEPPLLPVAMPRVEPPVPTVAKRRQPVRRNAESLELPLDTPKADLPVLSLGKDPKTGRTTLDITPQPKDKHVKPMSIILVNPLEEDIVKSLIAVETHWASSQSFLKEPLKQGVMLDTIISLNERLVMADTGMRIYRTIDRNPATGHRDDNYLRMVLRFDDKIWNQPDEGTAKLRSGAPSRRVPAYMDPRQANLAFAPTVSRDMMRAARYRASLNRRPEPKPKPEPVEETRNEALYRKTPRKARIRKPKETPLQLRLKIDTVDLKVTGDAGTQPITKEQLVMLEPLGNGGVVSPGSIGYSIFGTSGSQIAAVMRDKYAVLAETLALATGEKALRVSRGRVGWSRRATITFVPGQNAA